MCDLGCGSSWVTAEVKEEQAFTNNETKKSKNKTDFQLNSKMPHCISIIKTK